MMYSPSAVPYKSLVRKKERKKLILGKRSDFKNRREKNHDTHDFRLFFIFLVIINSAYLVYFFILIRCNKKNPTPKWLFFIYIVCFWYNWSHMVCSLRLSLSELCVVIMTGVGKGLCSTCTWGWRQTGCQCPPHQVQPGGRRHDSAVLFAPPFCFLRRETGIIQIIHISTRERKFLELHRPCYPCWVPTFINRLCKYWVMCRIGGGCVTRERSR